MEKKYLTASVKQIGKKIQVVASTATTDRQGESIDQQGWDLTNFLANPVMLWAHDYDSLPLGKWINVGVGDGELVMEADFAPADANPMAGYCQKLVEGGYQKTVSVGFIPLERNGSIITKAELLEVSWVPVPANPEALAFAMRCGISKDVFDDTPVEPDVIPEVVEAPVVVPEPEKTPEPIVEPEPLAEIPEIKEEIPEGEKPVEIVENPIETQPTAETVEVNPTEGVSTINDGGSQESPSEVEVSPETLKALLHLARQADKANELVLRIIKSALRNDKVS